MPMPPPKPSTEGPRDPQVRGEIRQLVRALQAEGPLGTGALEVAVGARYWEPGRFDRALALALGDGLAYRTSEDELAAS